MTARSCKEFRRKYQALLNMGDVYSKPSEEMDAHVTMCQDCLNWVASKQPVPSANEEVPATDESEDGEVLPGDYHDEESEYDEELNEFDKMD